MSGLVGGIALMLLFFILPCAPFAGNYGRGKHGGRSGCGHDGLATNWACALWRENWEAALDQPDASLEEGQRSRLWRWMGCVYRYVLYMHNNNNKYSLTMIDHLLYIRTKHSRLH